MTKYIDAELLKVEIDKLEEEARKVRVSGTDKEAISADGKVNICLKLKSIIDSLQQEQPELPNKGIAEYYYHKGVYEGFSKGLANALRVLDKLAKIKVDPVIVIKTTGTAICEFEINVLKEIKE